MGSVDGVMTGDEAGGLFPRLQQRYGLREDPLAMDSPFYPDAQRQHALESLRHLCGFGDMALLLTGAKGAGKTRILAELVRSESARLDFHPLDAEALTSPQALARNLLSIAYQGLGDGDSPQDAVFGFFRWSESATRKGRRLVLLIDNADRVPPEVILLTLSAYQAADTSQCAVLVLAGQDSLVEQAGLGADTTSGSVVHQIHLRPMVPDEIVAYLEPRVHRAGGKTAELLSARNIGQIYELSQGSFGRLKRVTPAVWLGLASVSSGRSGRAAWWSGMRWPAITVLLLGASWWLVSQQYDSVSAKNDQTEKTVPERTRSTITLGPGHFDNSPTVEIERSSPSMDASAGLSPADQGQAATSSPPEVFAESEPSPTLAQEHESLPDEASVPAPTAGARAQKALVSTVAPPPVPEPGSLPAQASEAVAAEPAQNAEAPAIGKAATEVVYTPARKARFIALETLHGEVGYTAQLIAGYQESTAVRFLKQHANVANLHYTRTERKGRDWFVVFYGHETTRSAMREAMGGLPKALREHAWVRQINTI